MLHYYDVITVSRKVNWEIDSFHYATSVQIAADAFVDDFALVDINFLLILLIDAHDGYSMCCVAPAVPF